MLDFHANILDLNCVLIYRPDRFSITYIDVFIDALVENVVVVIKSPI